MNKEFYECDEYKKSEEFQYFPAEQYRVNETAKSATETFNAPETSALENPSVQTDGPGMSLGDAEKMVQSASTSASASAPVSLSASASVARKLSRQLREVLCDEQYNLNRWPERRPGFYGYLQFFEHCNFFLGHVHPVRPIVFHDINTAVFSRLSVDRFTLAECFNVPLDRPQGNAEFARQTNHGL